MNHSPDTRYWFNKRNFALVAHPSPGAGVKPTFPFWEHPSPGTGVNCTETVRQHPSPGTGEYWSRRFTDPLQ